jgi:hypothetical protein
VAVAGQWPKANRRKINLALCGSAGNSSDAQDGDAFSQSTAIKHIQRYRVIINGMVEISARNREDNMDEKTYQRWWQYHLRSVKGEILAPAEQAEYEAGLQELDREEQEQLYKNSQANLRRAKTQVAELQLTHAQLMSESDRLDKRIAVLEKRYQSLTGYQLLTETYASS